MHDKLFESMAIAVKDAVESGMRSVIDRLEPRLKALEDKEPVIIKEIIQQNDMDAVAEAIKSAIDSIEFPESESVDYDRISKMICDVVSAIEIPAGEKGRDGRDGSDGKDGRDGENGKDGVNGVDGQNGKDGVNGVDGKDALDIEVLPEINIEKSYVRGTFASHKGGLWRSFEKTKGMRGWECIVSGVSDIDVQYDGERKASITISKSCGDVVEKEITIPALLHKGYWREGMKAEKGDYVQLGGAMWYCKEDTDTRPTDDSKSWMVAAKRGGTGDSAYQIAVKNGFEGSVVDWLNSLAEKKKVKL